jgi:hypothetical protein
MNGESLIAKSQRNRIGGDLVAAKIFDSVIGDDVSRRLLSRQKGHRNDDK